MTHLQFDSRVGLYVGELADGSVIRVDADELAESRQLMERDGSSYEEADAFCLNPANWSEDMAGVEIIIPSISLDGEMTHTSTSLVDGVYIREPRGGEPRGKGTKVEESFSGASAYAASPVVQSFLAELVGEQQMGSEGSPTNVIRPAAAPKVILSSALGFPGGIFAFDEVAFPASLAGMTSYVGHPATRNLVEALGAETDASGANGAPGKYVGPAVGESYLAVPLASNPREGGWTKDTAIGGVQDLKAILVTRIA